MSVSGRRFERRERQRRQRRSSCYRRTDARCAAPTPRSLANAAAIAASPPPPPSPRGWHAGVACWRITSNPRPIPGQVAWKGSGNDGASNGVVQWQRSPNASTAISLHRRRRLRRKPRAHHLSRRRLFRGGKRKTHIKPFLQMWPRLIILPPTLAASQCGRDPNEPPTKPCFQMWPRFVRLPQTLPPPNVAATLTRRRPAEAGCWCRGCSFRGY